MTPELERWQKTPELVKWWDTQFNSPQGKILQEVLHSLSTSRNIHNINADVASRDAVLFVGQQQGFGQVMENMKMLALSPLEQPKQPQATYGVDLSEFRPQKPTRKKK
jgi:hypothetical protein